MPLHDCRNEETKTEIRQCIARQHMLQKRTNMDSLIVEDICDQCQGDRGSPCFVRSVRCYCCTAESRGTPINRPLGKHFKKTFFKDWQLTACM